MIIKDWKNLLRNRCPKCNRLLDFESDKEMMLCEIACGFMIALDRMKTLCAQMEADKLLRDNFEDLQNIGALDDREEKEAPEWLV